MKRRTGISLLLALLMVVSTFTVVGVATGGGDCESIVYFDKTVWNGEDWVESVEMESGTVRFKITLTYDRYEGYPTDYRLKGIKVKDVLPDCLTFANNVDVQTTSISGVEYTEQQSGQCVYWNFTWDKPALDDGESLTIEFDATLGDCEPGQYDNWAYFTATESCGGYAHAGSDDASVVVPEECGEPGIDIEKKVWDGEEWVDAVTEYICLYDLMCEGECLDFQITVTNTGEVTLHDVVVEDLLPEFLYYMTPGNREIVWNLGNIGVGEFCEFTFTACICPYYFCENDMGVGVNYANATSDEDVFDEDSVDVTVYKRLTLEKQVWDGEQWVDLLEGIRIGETVKFRITVTYRGPEGSLMDCLLAGDLLENDCLEYDETTLVQVAGETLEPGTYQYPYIVPDAGNTILLCGEEVEVPELLECEGEYYVILWDFRGAWDFELHNEEQVVIEFDTTVTQYCECISTDVAFGLGWACYVCDPCNYYLDWDYAQVDCSPSETTFDKLVWDPVTQDWNTDEGVGVVGDVMTFKLEFEYYGNEELVDLRFKDVMPCVLEFAEVVESSINVDVDVSEDKKTVWFNMTEGTVVDGDVVTIVFTADVTGATGECCPDAYNKAWLYIFECTGQPIGEYFDEVSIVTRCNGRPYEPSIRDDETQGAGGETLTFYVTGSDPDNDDLYYLIDWGDGNEEWFGPYPHETEMEVTHEWDESGDYEVKVKSKDVWGAESDEWSDPINVHIEGDAEPDLAVTIKKGLGRGVKVTLKNNLETDINDIVWDIKVSKKILGKTLYHGNDTIELLESGNSTQIGGLTGFGFGLVSVNVNVTAAGMDPIIKTAKGFILGKFLFLR